jgi:outer membrane immunogenic protein
MAKLLLSAAALALFATGAVAADLPSYEAPPVVAPVPDDFSWTGFYAGLQAGYSFGDLESNVVVGNNEDEEFDAEGIVGGIFLGYNFGFTDAFVVGIEGDFEGTGIETDDDDDDGDEIDVGYDASVNWQGSIRGRAGIAIDRLLVYGTGGLAFADFDTNYDDGGNDDDDDDGNTELGWTVGAGVDYAFTDNIFVRGEYRYADYADFEDDEDDDLGDIQDLQSHTIRAGVGFKF